MLIFQFCTYNECLINCYAVDCKANCMSKYKLIYESNEIITGYIPQTREWLQYEGVLKIMDGGKTPISLEMIFLPPHPYAVNMPDNHFIKSQSVTLLYLKLVKFLGKYGVKFRR